MSDRGKGRALSFVKDFLANLHVTGCIYQDDG